MCRCPMAVIRREHVVVRKGNYWSSSCSADAVLQCLFPAARQYYVRPRALEPHLELTISLSGNIPKEPDLSFHHPWRITIPDPPLAN